MELKTKQIFSSLWDLVTESIHRMFNQVDRPCETAVTGRTETPETTSSRKRKAEGEQVQTAGVKKRKTEGEEAETVSGQKRKAEEAQQEEPSGKRRRSDTPPAAPPQAVKSAAPTQAVPTFQPRVTEIDRRVRVHKQRSHFISKYRQSRELGTGGFGTVFAGSRRVDGLPVAIKHIPLHKVKYTWVKYGDEVYQEISEVVLMAQAAGLLCADSEANPFVIGLLDVYKLKREVLIVMERPPDGLDILDLFVLREGKIPEHEAKSIFQQLLDAAVLMHRNRVFHRDIKSRNVLVSLSHQVPSVKIIDFGCSDFVQDEPYGRFHGTWAYAPPEVPKFNRYEAEPTTVWQIGVLLRSLYRKKKGGVVDYRTSPVRALKSLSPECNDFMKKCMARDPRKRPGLEELQRHPWFGR